MRCSLAILPMLAIGLATPAFAEDAASVAKTTCEDFNTLSATGDAAKLVNSHYAEKAIFIGPLPIAGILIGRDAIQKHFAGVYKTFNLSVTCGNAMSLNESTALVSGTWLATPKDPSGSPIKGSYGITYVNEGGKWLAAMDSWNVELPPAPAEKASQ